MSASDDIDDSAAPLIEHLAELRTRLIHSVIAFIIGMVICFTVWNPIFNFRTNPLCSAMAERGQEDCGLILIKLQEGFFVAISISLLGGLVLGFPYISYQLWRFVAPGLYKNEKGAFLPFLISSFVTAVSAAILAGVGLEAMGLGPQNEPTLGMTIFWIMELSAFLRGMWWWIVPPLAILVVLFVGLYLVNAGLDELANPRLRRRA